MLRVLRTHSLWTVAIVAGFFFQDDFCEEWLTEHPFIHFTCLQHGQLLNGTRFRNKQLVNTSLRWIAFKWIAFLMWNRWKFCFFPTTRNAEDGRFVGEVSWGVPTIHLKNWVARMFLLISTASCRRTRSSFHYSSFRLPHYRVVSYPD